MKQFKNVKDFINYYTLINAETEQIKEFNENLNDSETLQTQILKNLKASVHLIFNPNIQ